MLSMGSIGLQFIILLMISRTMDSTTTDPVKTTTSQPSSAFEGEQSSIDTNVESLTSPISLDTTVNASATDMNTTDITMPTDINALYFTSPVNNSTEDNTSMIDNDATGPTSLINTNTTDSISMTNNPIADSTSSTDIITPANTWMTSTTTETTSSINTTIADITSSSIVISTDNTSLIYDSITDITAPTNIVPTTVTSPTNINTTDITLMVSINITDTTSPNDIATTDTILNNITTDNILPADITTTDSLLYSNTNTTDTTATSSVNTSTTTTDITYVTDITTAEIASSADINTTDDTSPLNVTTTDITLLADTSATNTIASIDMTTTPIISSVDINTIDITASISTTTTDAMTITNTPAADSTSSNNNTVVDSAVSINTTTTSVTSPTNSTVVDTMISFDTTTTDVISYSNTTTTDTMISINTITAGPITAVSNTGPDTTPSINTQTTGIASMTNITTADITSPTNTTTADITTPSNNTPTDTAVSTDITTVDTIMAINTATASVISSTKSTATDATSWINTSTVGSTSASNNTATDTMSSINTSTADTTAAINNTGADSTASLNTTTISITWMMNTTTAGITPPINASATDTTSSDNTSTAGSTSPTNTTATDTTASINTTTEIISPTNNTTTAITSPPNTTTTDTTASINTTTIDTTASINTTTTDTTASINTTTTDTTASINTTTTDTTASINTTTTDTTASINTTTTDTTASINTTTIDTTASINTTTTDTTASINTTTTDTTASINTTTIDTTASINTTATDTAASINTTTASIASPSNTTATDSTLWMNTTTTGITSVMNITTAGSTSPANNTPTYLTLSINTTTTVITLPPNATTMESTISINAIATDIISIMNTSTASFPLPGNSTVVDNTSSISTTAVKITASTNATVRDSTLWINTATTNTTSMTEMTTAGVTSPTDTTLAVAMASINSTTTGTVSLTNITVVGSASTPNVTSMVTTSINTVRASATSSVPSDQSCFLPIIRIIPSTSSLWSPLQVRRSQDFFISSFVQFDCESSLSTTAEWTISNCSTTCNSRIQMSETVLTTSGELFIPARTLAYGTYQLTLTVTMIAAPHLSMSAFAYVKIIASGIIANLIQFGTSMITTGYQQDLVLDPGTFSVDPDAISFNANNWKYKYYCRIYGRYNFPNFLGSMLSIDDPRTDPLNPSCLSNRIGNGTGWQYGGTNDSLQSSLTILANSFVVNQTYQFKVILESRQNASVQATGYLLVQIEDNQSHLIVIACVISTLCTPNIEYQFVNPTTQVALFSVCTGTCTSVNNIIWNIYYGVMNSSTNTVQWTQFNHMNQYQNIWFFGSNTTNFTSTNNLFLANSSIEYWRFVVRYSFPSETSSSALHFIINQPSQNGSCSIGPLQGTTSTLFTISCSNWDDQEGIKDYSFYSWTTNPDERMMLAFSSISTLQLRLPAGNENTSSIQIIGSIRDTLDCVTEFNISSVIVVSDLQAITNLVDSLQYSSNGNTNNTLVQILACGNQNMIDQVISSLSQEFNKINDQIVGNAISNGIPAPEIVVSPLGSRTQQTSSTSMNLSALIEYNTQLNIYASVRDFLITYTTNLVISTADSIKLQASSLTQLTQATNQLTRSTSLLASQKCHQLALALYSIATRIPYEDVRTAAIQIAQCANNVLNAINRPLQQRTSILDLDLSHADRFPQDYDTDLESEWSNLNLFANGNDFSWQTIEKGRNTYYQKQTANQISIQTTETMSLLTSALHIHLNIGQNLLINTSSIFMSLETISIHLLSNKLIEQIEHAQIQMPSNFQLNTTDNSSISLRSMTQSLASFGNSRSQSNTNLSRTISLSLFDHDGIEIPLQTTLDYPIEFIIPRDPNLILPSMTLQNVTSHQQLFNLHFINIKSARSISIHFEMHSLDINLAYLFIYKFDRSPVLNSSMNQIDGWTLFCPSNTTNDSIYTYFIDNQKTVDHQSIIFGLRELNSTEMRDVCYNLSIMNPPITNEQFNFTSDYELRIYTSGCYYLDTNNNWQSDGLIVGPRTNHYETQCFSTHLTTFAGGFIVLPAPINWNNVFSNADFTKNKTVYLTLISVCILYLLLMIYARYHDKKDVEKFGVTPLPDNHTSDQYFYQILVFTGHRKDAGTNSKVHFVLAGDDDATKVRTFADPYRKIFQRGGIEAFIMTVPKSLGLLNYIHIWHDNTGLGVSASWFLKYLIVRDLQTMEKSYFICQKWLAVEEEDGVIERVLPVASEYEKQDLSFILSKQAYHSMSDGHLWFSIFSPPPSNKFTRVQRCTCCFILLLTTMLLNILYYDQVVGTKGNTYINGSVTLGSLYITSEQIGIGIIVEILSFLPTIFLVQFFRRLQPRHNPPQVSPLRQVICQIKQPPIPNTEVPSTKKTRIPLIFPWWCLFIAYGLSFVFAIIAIFYIIARGIEFGDLKSQKWLTSLLTGFFSSIFLTQPIQVAIIFAFFIRTTDKDAEAAEFIDEDYLHSIEDESPTNHRSEIRITRLDKTEIALARTRRLKDIQIWSIIREVCTYFIFLLLLYGITYSNMNDNAFYQVQHLRKFFLNSRQIDNDYTQISTTNQYWNWLEESFISNIRAQQWYNGEPPRNLSGFINDKSNRLIGWAIMRQIRIKPNSCQIQKSLQHLLMHCNDDYSFSNEEKQSFQPGWMNQTTEISNSSVDQAFIYRSADAFDSYHSGGYVYEFRGRLNDLRSNLSALHQYQWIDSQTRAVIIQLNLYNPNSQLFISVNFLAEFLSTGGVETQSHFEPISLHAFRSLSPLICLIFYMILIIDMMVVEIQALLKLKINYFRNFWSWINMGIIICSWTNVGIYNWRYRESIRLADLFENTNGFVYINLQFVVYINGIFTYLLAFCCFFGTIKCLYLCRFNQRLIVFMKTIQYASNDLLAFAGTFFIVFMAFTILFYLLFVSKMSSCASLLHTAQMLLEMILMNFDAHELSAAGAFLGPFCFSLFIFLVVFVCLSMFLTIINQSFRFVRANAKVKPNDDQHILLFMCYKFRRWIGLSRTNGLERFEEIDEQITMKYSDPIAQFPDKIDQLLDALSRLYMDQQTHILHREVKSPTVISHHVNENNTL